MAAVFISKGEYTKGSQRPETRVSDEAAACVPLVGRVWPSGRIVRRRFHRSEPGIAGNYRELPWKECDAGKYLYRRAMTGMQRAGDITSSCRSRLRPEREQMKPGSGTSWTLIPRTRNLVTPIDSETRSPRREIKRRTARCRETFAKPLSPLGPVESSYPI